MDSGGDNSQKTRAGESRTDQSTKIDFHTQQRPEGLSGMNLVNHVCSKKEKIYKKCVSKWFSEQFMPGVGTLHQEEACGEKFERYRRCVLKGIRLEVWDAQGLPTPHDNSPLVEVDDYGATDDS